MAFWVFEGIDGAGKSTLIQLVKDQLLKENLEVVLTREPGGTALGEELRAILLRTHSEAPLPKTELLLYEAIRSQHVEKVIRPALEKKSWVLCDRYTASTLAFQVGGRKMDRVAVDWLNEFATSSLKPDTTILLDLDTKLGQKRMENRALDRFEQEALDFHQRVRDYYLKLAKENPQNWRVLDAQNTPEDLFN